MFVGKKQKGKGLILGGCWRYVASSSLDSVWFYSPLTLFEDGSARAVGRHFRGKGWTMPYSSETLVVKD